ncbi:MAG: hypothetical protein ACK58N_01860 [Synechocystis sp.]|jgi:hypothetical protein
MNGFKILLKAKIGDRRLQVTKLLHVLAFDFMLQRIYFVGDRFYFALVIDFIVA